VNLVSPCLSVLYCSHNGGLGSSAQKDKILLENILWRQDWHLKSHGCWYVGESASGWPRPGDTRADTIVVDLYEAHS
jgi:hypothetical protein